MTNLERRSGVALWRQIAQILGSEIEAGEHAPESKLPTEPDLAARFGVNRHTVRRALSVLQDEGLVSIQQGRGTFVRARHDGYAFDKLALAMPQIGRGSRNMAAALIACQHLGATPEIAAALGLAPGTEVILMEMLMVASPTREPVAVSSHYFAAARFEGLERRVGESQSLDKALAHYGVANYTQEKMRMSAGLPTEEDATQLRIARNQPVLVAEQVNVDATFEPFEFVLARVVGGRVQLLPTP